MIDQVKIGAMTYRVVLKPDEDMIGSNDGKAVRLDGSIVYSSLTISINQSTAPEKRVEIVLHEAIHGILKHAAQEAPEAVVQALGYGLLALIRDNPDLLLWIREDTAALDRAAKELVKSNGHRP